MCYFIKKITHFYKKGQILTKIFKVYKGKIAIFAISNKQIHTHSQFIEPVDVEFLAITREIRDHQKLTATRAIADGLHVRKRSKEMLAVLFGELFGFGDACGSLRRAFRVQNSRSREFQCPGSRCNYRTSY